MSCKSLRIAALIALIGTSAWGQQVEPVDMTPGRHATRHCLAELRQTTRRTNHAMQEATGRCVRAINQLQSEGDPAGAEAAAMQCDESLNRISTRGTQRVTTIVQRCTEVLTQIGAPKEAFAALEQAAQEVATKIAEKLTRALAAVATALEE